MTIDRPYTFLGIFLGFSLCGVTSCYAASVGDSYGGGTVFCVSQTPDTSKCITVGSGPHGLIMANEDQANYIINPAGGIKWASVYNATKAQSDDNGFVNSARIIYALPKDNPTNNAAWLCHHYRDPREKHTDWYLPARYELSKMFLHAKANYLIGKGCSGSKPDGVQCLIGNKIDEQLYWSSTEYSDDDYAWFVDLSNGSMGTGIPKILGHFGVRAIRAF